MSKQEKTKAKDVSGGWLVSLTKFFITRWRITMLVLIAILLAGSSGLMMNQRQDFPTINANYIIVQSVYPGASSGDIENKVVIPQEQAIKSIDNIVKVRSESNNNYGLLNLEMDVFDKETLNKRASEISDEILKLDLPSEVEPNVFVADASGASILLGIVGDSGQDTGELLKYAGEIKKRLESASSEINKVEVWPSEDFKIQIDLDAKSMAEKQLNYTIIKASIESYIASIPGGEVKSEDGRTKTIIINSGVSSLEDFENITDGNTRLGDIATIQRVPMEEEAFYYGAYKDKDNDDKPVYKEAPYLAVYKNDNGDVINIAKAIEDEIDAIEDEKLLPDDVKIVTFSDSSIYVESQISDLMQSGLWGLFLIIFVLLFFVNFRAALVISMVLPLSFLITIFVLYEIGFTINILTMFGLILALGVLVDNAIVVTEGILYEMEKGRDKRSAILWTVKKLGSDITAATLTTVVAFIPFTMLGGIMGEFLKFIPITVNIMLITSYLLALTITPLLSKVFLKARRDRDKKVKTKTWEKVLIIPVVVKYGQHFVEDTARRYKRGMEKVYKSAFLKTSLILVTIGFIGSGFYLSSKLGGGQMPDTDSWGMQITTSYPAGTPTELKKEVVEKVLAEVIELKHFENAYYYEGQLYVEVTVPSERSDSDETIFTMEDDLNKELKKISADYEDIELKAARSGYGPPGEGYDFAVAFKDQDLEKLERISRELEEYLLERDDLSKVKNDYDSNLLDSISIDIDEEKAQSIGVNNLMTAGMIRATFADDELGTVSVRKDGVGDKVYLGFNDASKDSVDDLKSLPMGPENTLEDIAEVKEVQSLSRIRRLEGERVVEVGMNIDEQDAKKKIEKINELKEDILDYLGLEEEQSSPISAPEIKVKDSEKLDEWGIEEKNILVGGAGESFDTDMRNLMIVAMMALIGVYLILVYQFHSFAEPTLIMLSIVMALAGMFFGLTIFDETVNLISGLGIVALIGIAVNNAIVFIDTINHLKAEHPEKKLKDILAQAGYLRFKPIISTTITTTLGILPLALRDPLWRGLGICIIAGLLFATIGTLMVIPTIYHIANSFGISCKKGYCKIVKKNG